MIQELDFDKVVISSRVRIARNVSGIIFVPNGELKGREELIAKVHNAVKLLGNYKVYHMGKLNSVDSAVMQGKHLISKELFKNKASGACLINTDETISIMVNEEDHIRAQCILKGFNLEKAYAYIDEIDDELDSKLDIAFSPTFGYLTSCITNLGTGLRASVMLFLPALTIAGKIDEVISAVKVKGLTVRGEKGEGSLPLGYYYQLSNSNMIGVSEREILNAVISGATKLVELELEERNNLLKLNPDLVVDLAWRAFGILSNCYTIDYEEFMKLIGEVKLGVHLGLIKLKESEIIDKLLIICTDSAIIKLSNKILTSEEISRIRAEELRKTLKRARIN